MPPFEKLRKMHSPFPGSFRSECNKAARILDAFTNPLNPDGRDSLIPPKVLGAAKASGITTGFAIFSVSKLGIVGSVRMGSGILIARLEDGDWSAPSAILTAGVGVGSQLGVEVTNFVFVLNTTSAVRTFAQLGSLSLGKTASFAMGPSGRFGEVNGVVSAGGMAGIFVYGHNQGFFGGFSTEGSMIFERRGANQKLYGKKIKARDLIEGQFPPPEEADELMNVLRSELFAPRPELYATSSASTKGSISSGRPSQSSAGTDIQKKPIEMPADEIVQLPAELPAEFIAELPAEVVPDIYYDKSVGSSETLLPELPSETASGGEQCVFPGPKRAPRQLKRPPIAEVLAQLRQLEQEVQLLRAQAQQPAEAGASPLGHPLEEAAGPLEPGQREGRLVVKEGKSRYVGDAPSAVLGDKIRELHDICDASSSEDELETPETSGLHFASSLGGNWRDHSLRDTYLQPDQMQRLWQVYQNNVAPLLAVLHVPSVEIMVREESENINPDPAREALILAVCFAAIVTIPPDQCMALVGMDCEKAIQSYQLAVDQALVRANFIKSQNICVLQAAVIFLLCLRWRGDARLVWAASAVVVRVAQGQGIHRDGQSLGLSPFDSEMRRRLWWHICLLDMVCSEDQGTDAQIQPGMFDTRLPHNIDGADLDPSLTELPPEKTGATDITLLIIQCDIISELNWPNRRNGGARDAQSTADREPLVTTVANRLEDRFLQHLDINIPIQWVYAMIIRLTLSKLWLYAHYNKVAGHESRSGCSQAACDDAFQAAVETIKFTILLHTNESTSQWAWLCKTYKQWHTVAFILAELCNRPITAETDHAWQVVTEIQRQWEQDGSPQSVMLRKPLKRLMQRTASTRAAKMGISPGSSLGTEIKDDDSFGSGLMSFDTNTVPGMDISQVPLGQGSLPPDVYSLGMAGFGVSGMEWLWEPLL
ncbi:transcriptional regulator family: Fungal Specific TF [Aspergillus niger]|nr:transcriptional regulator family: Fungal Specific TF [Aspergillus niger]KAI3009606.1 transcriptional regulator family: Fungal Specific TF [Aspergillus niger]